MTKASGKKRERKRRAEDSSVSELEGDREGGEARKERVTPPNAGKGPINRETGEWAGPGSVNDSRRCTGTARQTGERCKKAAEKGGHLCKSHGGALPGVRKAARERLLELVDPALAALDKVLRDPNKDDNVKVKAAIAVLDRTGYRPGIVVEVAPSDRWSGLLTAAAAGADDRSGLLIEAATEALASEHEAERVQGVLDELDALNDEDAEARRETRIDNQGHTVLQGRVTDSTSYSVFNRRGEGPTDRRSEYDPVPPGAGARTREQILLERLEEPDEEPGTWRSGHR